MNKDRDKKKKLIYLVVFFSLIIFMTSLFFIKYELALTKKNRSFLNINWQQIRDDFNQMTNIIKENYQNLANLNSQITNVNTPALSSEEIELLKEKIEEINVNNSNNENINQ